MLSTLGGVKAKLGIANTTQDALLTTLIEQTDARIRTYCAREFESATFTEYPTCYGTRQMRLKQKPIISITSIHVDSTRVFAANSLLTAGTDYSLVDGKVLRVGTVWPNATENRYGLLANAQVPAVGVVKVVYAAGYATIPPDVVLASDLLIALEYRSRKLGGPTQSESLEDYSYARDGTTVGAVGLPGVVAGLLAPYVRRRI